MGDIENKQIKEQGFIQGIILWIGIPSLVLIVLVLIFSLLFIKPEASTDKDWRLGTSFLMFFVGAFIAGVGALAGGGIGESKIAGRGAYNPHSARQIMLVDERLSQRGKQLNFGMKVMIVGSNVLLVGLLIFFLT